MAYQDLEVYNISFDLFIETHKFSFNLPKYEMFELGSQIRRSADSVNSNIVEGYGRRMYKKDYLKFLIYAHSSNDETINHLKKIEILYPSLIEESTKLINEFNVLGRKINRYIEYVKNNWRT